MRLLAIESSGREFSVAFLDDRGLVETQSGPAVKSAQGGGTSSTLAPTISSVLTSAGATPPSLEVVAVSLGPGSFTGLRVGITTASALAYSLGIPIIGVDTHLVLANQAVTEQLDGELLRVVTNAQRKQLFCSTFQMMSGEWNRIGDLQILDRQTWLDQLQEGDWVSGSGLAPLVDELNARSVKVCSETNWEPTAAVLGAIAMGRARRSDFDDVWKLKPRYFRPSAAEEKAAAIDSKSAD